MRCLETRTLCKRPLFLRRQRARQQNTLAETVFDSISFGFPSDVKSGKAQKSVCIDDRHEGSRDKTFNSTHFSSECKVLSTSDDSPANEIWGRLLSDGILRQMVRVVNYPLVSQHPSFSLGSQDYFYRVELEKYAGPNKQWPVSVSKMENKFPST